MRPCGKRRCGRASNQGINGTLINPVGLLLLSNQYGEGDKGNIIVGADVSWKVAKRATIQAQLALDDLQIQKYR